MKKQEGRNIASSYFSTVHAGSSLHFSKKKNPSTLFKGRQQNVKRTEYTRKVFLLSMSAQTCHKTGGVF